MKPVSVVLHMRAASAFLSAHLVFSSAKPSTMNILSSLPADKAMVSSVLSLLDTAATTAMPLLLN